MRILVKILLFAAVVVILFLIIWNLRKRNEQKTAGNVNPVTSVSGANTATGQQESGINASNAGKKVMAKFDNTRPYAFNTYVQGYFPSYAKSASTVDIYPANSNLGTFQESFTAFDVNTLYDLVAQKISTLKDSFGMYFFGGNASSAKQYIMQNGGGQQMSDEMTKGKIWLGNHDLGNNQVDAIKQKANGLSFDNSSAKSIFYKAGDKFWKQSDVIAI